MTANDMENAPVKVDVAANLVAVRARIGNAATLVAVSKTFPADHIRPALVAGQRVFGENRVQEAMEKWPALRIDYPETKLHLIGPLQTNKARDAVALFDVIETVDRPKLAAALRREIDRAGRAPEFYVEVNTGGEAQRRGSHRTAPTLSSRPVATKFGLPIEGLMCLPPVGEDPGPHFLLLADIAARNGLEVLSMGMSADFEIAISCGATHVRVGTAIFGKRAPRV